MTTTNPANGAVNVSQSLASITVNFDQAVTLTGAWLTLTCDTAGVITVSPQAGTDVTSGSVDITGVLPFDETCTGTVLSANVSNANGQLDDGTDYVFTFTTEDDPTLACGDPVTVIETITPASGAVTIQGVVVAAYENQFDGVTRPNGFFVQDVLGTDPALSDGIFVFTGGSPAGVSVGDEVRVSGNAGQFGGKRQIGGGSTVIDCGPGTLPAPTIVTLPFDTDTFADRYVGMLVTLPQTLTVTNTFVLGRFGEFDVTSGDRLRQPTQVHPPGSPEAAALADANILDRLVIDDDVNTQNYDPIIYPPPELTAANTLRSGSTVANITGVMDFGFDEYRIRPVIPEFPVTGWDFTLAPRPQNPPNVGGDITVAGFNVLNYFTTLDDGSNTGCGPLGNMGCRGAQSGAPTDSAGRTEFERQEIKIVDAICRMDSDIVGLIELENPRSTDEVDIPMQTLVNALNAYPDCGTYDYVLTGTIGTDAIKNGFIYQTNSVAPAGDFALLDSSIDPTFIDTRNRPVLAVTFEVIDPLNPGFGNQVTVAVNHLKSKGSGCGGAPDDDPEQGNCNGTRTAAAQAMANWLATNPTNADDPYTLIIGDLNAYALEDPIQALVNAGYTDLARNFNLNNYSYSFQGRWGTLDYAMGNAAVLPFVTGAAEWHINADEPRTLEYVTRFFTVMPGQADKMFLPDAFRSSDHDPIIVGLALPPLDTPVVTGVVETGGVPLDGLTFNHEIGTIDITFNIPVFDDSTGNDPNSASNPDNYILLAEGSVSGFQTVDCAGGVSPDDERIVQVSTTYTPNTTTLTFSPLLGEGVYRLHICGTTSIVSAANPQIALNGGEDTVVDFTIDVEALVIDPVDPTDPTDPVIGEQPAFTPAQPEDLGIAELPATGERPLWAEILRRWLTVFGQ